VFSAPSRPAAHAADIASARFSNVSELGSSLSAQAWGICKKIAEVDDFLLTTPEAWGKVREMHPEVCFWSLNGRRPMPHSKKSRQGVAERLAVLEAIEPRTRSLYEQVMDETLRKDVQRDDILDALVGCLTARAIATDDYLRLSGDPDRDERGLPMEMIYRTPMPIA
jgi:predicted RNase H-like nuclease